MSEYQFYIPNHDTDTRTKWIKIHAKYNHTRYKQWEIVQELSFLEKSFFILNVDSRTTLHYCKSNQKTLF